MNTDGLGSLRKPKSESAKDDLAFGILTPKALFYGLKSEDAK